MSFQLILNKLANSYNYQKKKPTKCVWILFKLDISEIGDFHATAAALQGSLNSFLSELTILLEFAGNPFFFLLH